MCMYCIFLWMLNTSENCLGAERWFACSFNKMLQSSSNSYNIYYCHPHLYCLIDQTMGRIILIKKQMHTCSLLKFQLAILSYTDEF